VGSPQEGEVSLIIVQVARPTVPLHALVSNLGCAMATVLLVDDDPNMREVMAALLEAHGFRVCLAADGIEAETVWRSTPVHLVITDLQMPRRDGLETIRLLQNDLPGLPIIACSGCATEVGAHGLREAARMGALPLLKPFLPHELFTLVSKALPPAAIRDAEPPGAEEATEVVHEGRSGERRHVRGGD
jgi:CheY-like chemotaxis protein